jgi:NDP-mannose synthase
MRAVVLAGGLGTRLRPYTTVIPKPLVPVGDRPILEHILHQLADAGITHTDLCVSHLGELIQVYFSQDHAVPDGMHLAFHWEDEPLGTAGALRVVPELESTFIAMNGDVLTTLDYETLVDYHLERDAALTVAIRGQRVDVDLGVVESEDGLVRAYTEKPTLRFNASMGIYVFDERALQWLPAGQPFQIPDLVLRLLAAGERVAAFESDADWFDIGTVGEYERASADVERFPDKYGLEASAMPPHQMLPAMQGRNSDGVD